MDYGNTDLITFRIDIDTLHWDLEESFTDEGVTANLSSKNCKFSATVGSMKKNSKSQNISRKNNKNMTNELVRLNFELLSYLRYVFFSKFSFYYHFIGYW